jgi:nucleotide-binding universal stress UspA family protein
MALLVLVDDSQSSQEAVRYAGRSAAQHHPQDEVWLVHISPSARVGDLERGRFLLETARRSCRDLVRGVRITTRLEVGEPRERLHQVEEESGCRLVVLGAQGVNPSLHLERVSAEAVGLAAAVTAPVLLVLPTGEAVRAVSIPWEEPEGTTGAEAR